MKTLIFTLFMIFASGSMSAQKDVKTILDKYIELKNALIKSDSKQASLFATELAVTLEGENDFKNRNELIETVQKIKKTSEIEKQRESFSVLSNELWSIVKNATQINDTIYYQYCPMKKAYWLSTDSVIKNPYYGSKMLSCGSVSERKN